EYIQTISHLVVQWTTVESLCDLPLLTMQTMIADDHAFYN
ncbi:34511_t:CDS:1, partial [Racocetra persica]